MVQRALIANALQWAIVSAPPMPIIAEALKWASITRRWSSKGIPKTNSHQQKFLKRVWPGKSTRWICISINSLAMRNFVLRNFAFAIQRQSGDKWSHHNLSARRPTMDKKLPPLSSLKPFDLHHFTFTFFLRNSLQSGFWIGPTYPNPSPIYGKCVGKFSSI